MNVLAFDLETDLIQPGLLTPPTVCGSLDYHPAAGDPAVLPPAKAYDFLAEWLRADHIVGANVAYDLAIVCVERPDLVPAIFTAYDEGRIHDVQIRQALDAIARGHLFQDPRTGGPLIDPESGKRKDRYSLAICADLTLGRRIAKADTWRMRYARLRGVPLSDWPADALQYPKDDARNTLDVFFAQEGLPWRRQPGDREDTPERCENLHDEPRQTRAAFALHLACVWGMRTDAARVGDVVKRVEKIHAETQERFKKAGILRADGSKDTKHLADIVSTAYGGAPPQTDTGRVKMDRDTLSESGDELLESFSEAGENEKLFTQYLDIIRQGAERPINPSANVLVASGRTSYSRPNLQNIPRGGGIRETFAARPKHVYVKADYAALEFATFAQIKFELFGHCPIKDALDSGLDPHLALAAEMLGIAYPDLVAQHKKGDKEVDDIRQAAKAGNFGFGGGMGAPKFVLAKRKEGLRFCRLARREPEGGCGSEVVTAWKGRECPAACKACVEIAQELRDAWFRRWDVKPFFDYVARITDGEMGGTIVDAKTGFARGGCGFTDGANTHFQGRAAHGAKDALGLVSRECYTDRTSPLWGSRVVVFVHDEIILESPEEKAAEAGERLAALMVQGMRGVCPDVPIKAEPALMKRWDKRAKTLRGPDGKLRVWEPDADSKSK